MEITPLEAGLSAWGAVYSYRLLKQLIRKALVKNMKITEEKDGKVGRLKGRFNGIFFDTIQEMPGKKKFDGGDLVFEMTRMNVEFLREKFPEAEWDSRRLSDLDAMFEMEAERRKQMAAPMPAEAVSFHFKTTPMEHQAQAFGLFKDAPYHGLFFEQGLGKTKTEIDIAAYKWTIGEIDTVLISAPNGVHLQWLTEAIPQHMPDFLKCSTWGYTATQTKKQLEAMEETFAHDTTKGLRVFSINKESCITPKGIKFLTRVLSSGKVFWIADESPFMKTPGAAVTKSHLKLAPLATARAILTGTPVGSGIENLYTQLKFLHTDVLGFNSFYTFKNRYCNEQQIPGAPIGAKRIVSYKHVEELKEKMNTYCLRKTAAECLDLKDPIYVSRYVDLTAEQKRVYVDLVEDTVAKIDSGEIVSADQTLTRLLRLQQIVNGFVKDVEGDIRVIDSNRHKAAYDFVEEAAGKVVVWARFHYDIDLLEDVLKKKNVVVWDGRRSTEEKMEAKRRFIEDKDCGVFLANQDSAGTGTDGLQHVSRSMLFYSNNFKATTRWQAESRLHRYGQPNSVVIGDLVAKGTVDVRILNILKLRKNTADMVLTKSELRNLIV